MPTFPTPTQIFTRYKNTLVSLKPDVNPDDPSAEAFVRGRALSGIVSGLYGDQRMIDDDTFTKDARPEALLRKGEDFNIARQPATSSTSSDILLTGTAGATVAAGTTMRYIPTGVLYTVQSLVTLDGSGNGHAALVAQTAGQIGNVSIGGVLQFITPVPGVNPNGTLVVALADGSDIETFDSYRARLLSRQQRPPAGGNQFDYPNFAFAASPTVRSAFIRRFGRGLGTVDVYITTGTTDIDTAITQGQPILRIPSGGTIATIQAYYDANVPLTDCPRVFAPTEVTQNVTVNVALASGLTLSTSVPADATYNPLGLTVAQLIQREVARVLYKVPVGGRVIPGRPGGYVVAADIERQLDIMLSAAPDSTGLPSGNLPILTDRQVQKLDGANYDRMLNANELAAPGTTTIVLGV